MSIHMHLRAVAESEIRDDHTWLAAFMWRAWENHPDEYAAGIAESIDKVWGSVNDLYAAADVLDADADDSWELPIYGGRPVAHGAAAHTALTTAWPAAAARHVEPGSLGRGTGQAGVPRLSHGPPTPS
ncbi:hypothetical protein [Streptomyces collinus]|uniref:hypothetical protein n=1 Tax=Streptomyces collinus TaxID=42684 RepID=UPI0036972386